MFSKVAVAVVGRTPKADLAHTTKWFSYKQELQATVAEVSDPNSPQDVYSKTAKAQGWVAAGQCCTLAAAPPLLLCVLANPRWQPPAGSP